MKFKKLIFFVLVNLCVGNFYSQNITYDLLNSTSETLKEYLSNSEKYFSGGTSDLPYFQGKLNDSYIKFYKSTGVIVIFDLKSQAEYSKIIRTIQNNAYFRFKFCTDYNEPIVYNYQTNSGNKIRFNFNQMRISVEYPSKTNSFLESNSEFTPVFVCISEGAYAYHTNLRCEGLANCDAQIAKSNIKEAKKYNYRICEICTSDE
jgi:hypothetical protein